MSRKKRTLSSYPVPNDLRGVVYERVRPFLRLDSTSTLLDILASVYLQGWVDAHEKAAPEPAQRPTKPQGEHRHHEAREFPEI